MSLHRIEMSATAKVDIEEIQSYIALDSPGRATAFTLRILDRIATLERLPRRHPIVRDATSLGESVRAVVVAPYKVYYTVAGNMVYVLHVRHGARGSPDRE